MGMECVLQLCLDELPPWPCLDELRGRLAAALEASRGSPGMGVAPKIGVALGVVAREAVEDAVWPGREARSILAAAEGGLLTSRARGVRPHALQLLLVRLSSCCAALRPLLGEPALARVVARVVRAHGEALRAVRADAVRARPDIWPTV
jgi:hypothetical protein